MKNLKSKKGFKNRHKDSLPKIESNIKIIVNDIEGEQVILCKWIPFNKDNYTQDQMPAEGYLGTAKIIEKRYNGIGFHALKENDSEFIYYTENIND